MSIYACYMPNRRLQKRKVVKNLFNFPLQRICQFTANSWRHYRHQLCQTLCDMTLPKLTIFFWFAANYLKFLILWKCFFHYNYHYKYFCFYIVFYLFYENQLICTFLVYFVYCNQIPFTYFFTSLYFNVIFFANVSAIVLVDVTALCLWYYIRTLSRVLSILFNYHYCFSWSCFSLFLLP